MIDITEEVDASEKFEDFLIRYLRTQVHLPFLEVMFPYFGLASRPATLEVNFSSASHATLQKHYPERKKGPNIYIAVREYKQPLTMGDVEFDTLHETGHYLHELTGKVNGRLYNRSSWSENKQYLENIEDLVDLSVLVAIERLKWRARLERSLGHAIEAEVKPNAYRIFSENEFTKVEACLRRAANSFPRPLVIS